MTFPLIVADSKNHTFFKANIAHAHRAGHCCPLDSALFQTNLLPCEPSPETGIVFSRGLEFQSVRRVGEWPQSPQRSQGQHQRIFIKERTSEVTNSGKGQSKGIGKNDTLLTWVWRARSGN